MEVAKYFSKLASDCQRCWPLLKSELVRCKKGWYTRLELVVCTPYGPPAFAGIVNFNPCACMIQKVAVLMLVQADQNLTISVIRVQLPEESKCSL